MRTLCIDLTPWRYVATKIVGALCRAAYFGPFAPIRLRDIPIPSLPGPEWVRVRTVLAGICGSDVQQVFINGSLSIVPVALSASSRGYLGHEAVGEVVEVGPEVADFALGDRVAMDGTWDCFSRGIAPPCASCAAGNRIVCERVGEAHGGGEIGGGWGEEFVRHHSNLYHLPAEMSDEEAVLLEPASNGVRAALRGSPRPGERVLVIGAGTIGLMTIAALRAAEPALDITASVLYPRQGAEAVERGANRAAVAQEILQTTVETTGARLHRGIGRNVTTTGGFDLICDCVGDRETLPVALRCTRAGGRVVLVGAGLYPMTLDLTPVWYREVDLLGTRSHGAEEWKGSRLNSYDRVVQWWKEGLLDLSRMVTHRFPLAEYPAALKLAAGDKELSGSIKIVFDPRQESSG